MTNNSQIPTKNPFTREQLEEMRQQLASFSEAMIQISYAERAGLDVAAKKKEMIAARDQIQKVYDLYSKIPTG